MVLIVTIQFSDIMDYALYMDARTRPDGIGNGMRVARTGIRKCESEFNLKHVNKQICDSEVILR